MAVGGAVKLLIKGWALNPVPFLLLGLPTVATWPVCVSPCKHPGSHNNGHGKLTQG